MGASDIPLEWDLSCPDWEERLRTGRSLVPDLPLVDRVAGDRAVAVINRLRLADVPGTPTLGEAGGPWFTDIVRAMFGSYDPVRQWRAIVELFLLVPKKNSKALALDTLIATPTGFTTMGAVQVGDWVLAADGTPTTVVTKSEVFTERDCFEVVFSTGEVIVCDAQHLWVTDAHTDREKQPRASRSKPAPSVKTTAEIYSTLKVKSGKYSIANHRTELCAALDLPEADLPIPPYVLGAWLGDGHTAGATLTQGAEDAEHIMRSISATGHSVSLKGHDKRTGAARISIAEARGNEKLPYRFRTEAIELGVLGNKHIPESYLRGSYEQRLALLQGLMDTDGHISKAGQACFSTTLPALKDGAMELVNSLGMKSSVSQHRAKLGAKDCGPCWRVQFWPFSDQPVFTLPRKLERQRPASGVMRQRSKHRQIVDVRPVPSVPTQCIGVANASHQFLVTRSLIPTHNTTNGALLMLTALLLNQRPYAPFALMAPVQDTADEAFAAAEGAILLDPVLEKKFHIQSHKKTIVHRETKADLKIMTFDPDVLTGKKFVGTLIDELHVIAKNQKAAKALRQVRGGMVPFPEAFLAFITTMPDEAPVGVMKAELNKARAVRDGTSTGKLLPVLYELPPHIQKDKSKWSDPAYWPRVTPNLGRSVTIDKLMDLFKTARDNGEEDLRGWASQHLNLEIGLALKSDSWVGAAFWEQCAGQVASLDDLMARCEVCTVGIDGGGLDDLLGLTVIGREKETGKWLWWSHAWAHQIVLERRKDIASTLQDFERDGDLTIVDMPGEDVQDLADIVCKLNEAELLPAKLAIGVDPAGIGDIIAELTAEDRGILPDQIIAIPQGWKLNGAIKSTERRLAGGDIEHGGRPMMNWVLGNAKVEDRGNAILITKAVSGKAKVDPLLAGFSAISLMALNPSTSKKKYQFFAVG